MYPVSAAYMTAIGRPIKTRRILGAVGNILFDDSNLVSGTFKIDNQCSSGSELELGSVYIGQLTCVFNGINLTGEWMGKTIEVEERLLIDEENDTWEAVPLGVYHVVEAQHQETGVYVVAYDVMDYLDKTWIPIATTGTPWDYISLISQKTGVDFAQTSEEIAALPNGNVAFALYPTNDMTTYRDLLFWVAQTMACFATANRQGRIEFRRYGSTAVDTIGGSTRWQGSSFSDYITRYTGVSLTRTEEQSTIYKGAEIDDALTYNLGANPLMQNGSADVPLTNILNALTQIAYTPFSVDRSGCPAYDLGDVLTFPDGIGGNRTGCIMAFEYDYHDVYMIDGYGANPALSGAQSKADKEIAGLMSRANAEQFQYYAYTNAEALTIDDDYVDIINLRFGSTKSTLVTFNAEIKLESEITEQEIESVVGNIKYIWNGVEMDYHPAETWIDGKHLLHLMYLIPIQDAAINTLKVRMNCEGGTGTVGIADLNAYIAGQGLVATSAWDGWIEAEDNITEITIADGLSVAEITEELTTSLVTPIVIEVEDAIVPVEVSGAPIIARYGEIIYINKEPLLMLTWGDVKALGTWQNIVDDYGW